MVAERCNLHVLFFPGVAYGHIFPMAASAKVFAARGVRATILTTPANAPIIHQSIAGADGSLPEGISFRLIPFPYAASGIPEGCENFSLLHQSLHFKLLQSLSLLRNPFKQVVGELLPDCVITDIFMPWTYEAAAEVGVPRLVLHGTSFFSMCVYDYMVKLWPLKSLPSGTHSFELPAIPHRIHMLVSQIPDFHKAGGHGSEFFKHICDIDAKSYGVLVNSFSDLEPEYARLYREVMGKKAWNVGPLALCNKAVNEDCGDCTGCMKWLDGKPPRSVVYICFGSTSTFTGAQLREMAVGLEDSGHPFIWVVGIGACDDYKWIPEGFEHRVKDRGLIIRGWAPQLRILKHAAIGGFMTHCGWNSVMESIAAGLPMATWPLYADQFYNERLVVKVLKIGVEVGALICRLKADERAVVEAKLVASAVKSLMGKGEEAEERRMRVVELGKKSREAVEVGGSSYEDLGSLISELAERKAVAVQQSNRTAASGGEREEQWATKEG